MLPKIKLMYMYACMHACMYVCMYVCMHACNRKDKKMGMVNSSDFIAGFVGAKSDRSEGMIFCFRTWSTLLGGMKGLAAKLNRLDRSD